MWEGRTDGEDDVSAPPAAARTQPGRAREARTPPPARRAASGAPPPLAGPVGIGSAIEYARRGGGGAGRYAQAVAEEGGDGVSGGEWRGATEKVKEKVLKKTREEVRGMSDEEEVFRGDDVDDNLRAVGNTVRGRGRNGEGDGDREGIEEVRKWEGEDYGEGSEGSYGVSGSSGSFEGSGEESSDVDEEEEDDEDEDGYVHYDRAEEFEDEEEDDDDEAAAEFAANRNPNYYAQRQRQAAEAYAEDHDDDYGDDYGDEHEHGDGDSEEYGSDGEPLVRQDSNFSRLSAQSWLTVDSAESIEGSGDGGAASAGAAGASGGRHGGGRGGGRSGGRGEGERIPAVENRRGRVSANADAVGQRAADGPGHPHYGEDLSELPDELAVSSRPRPRPILSAPTHMDVRQVGRPSNTGLMDVLDIVHSKTTLEKTVLECAVELLASTAAYKKKAWRRFGVRRVWLSADCERLCWTSKKDGVKSDYLRLSRVARLLCKDREVAIDIMEGHRIALLFANSDEANMWTRCLSCLVPMLSRVKAPPGVVPSEKEREDFNLVDDTFNGRSLRSYGSVNSYVVLGPVRGHSGEARLVLSRADKTFFGMRFIAADVTPLILRSHEEIAVLKRLSHPNLVKHHECLSDTGRGGHYVIFEHTPRGVVTETQRLENVAPIPERAARIIMRDIINALEYMHALRIVHADIRPDNLLRAVNGSVKVNPIGCITQDFTEIHDMTSLVRARLGSASPAFLAPELCWDGNAPAIPHKSYAMDVWSVGAVLYFLLYGRVPFGGASGQDVQRNICTAKLKFPRMPETSRKVRNLLKGVLGEKDPKTRIALSELKKHPWFAEGIDEEEGYLSRGATNVRLVVSAEEVESAVGQAKVRAPAAAR